MRHLYRPRPVPESRRRAGGRHPCCGFGFAATRSRLWSWLSSSRLFPRHRLPNHKISWSHHLWAQPNSRCRSLICRFRWPWAKTDREQPGENLRIEASSLFLSRRNVSPATSRLRPLQKTPHKRKVCWPGRMFKRVTGRSLEWIQPSHAGTMLPSGIRRPVFT